jgi:amino acid adenylation domain-containing protein
MERASFRFPDMISGKLKEISKAENIRLSTICIRTVGILLHKYSGENDFNIVAFNDNISQSLTGSSSEILAKPSVIRMAFDQEISFKNGLKSIDRIFSDAIKDSEITLEKILSIINPGYKESNYMTLPATFYWTNTFNNSRGDERINEINYGLPEKRLFFDIIFSMWENPEGVAGEIVFNTTLFKRETIIRLRDNYIDLVKNLINGYDKPISSIPLITDEEKRRVLDFTDTAATYPSEKTIAQLFEDQVELYPNKTAIVYRENTLTYDQLNRKSNQLARMLIEEGIKKNKPVGILADKSIDLIVGILGILKAGGAYLPLDTEYPADRINFMILDSGCQVILTQQEYVDLPIKSATKRYLDSPASYHHDDHNVINEVTSSDLAYIMYTSGTTGKPKGSMIRQKSVVRLVRNTNYIDLTSEDRILLTGAIVFDATTFEIWGSLLNGGSLYILDKEDILDCKILGDALFKYEITTLWLTSSLFTQIAEYRTDIFSNLKYLLVGGDVLSPSHINKVRKNNPHLKIINGYGPTENTTFSTAFLIDRDFEHNIPIGKPISNSTVYIFDKYLNCQPIGIVGEIYVGGDGLSGGYLNREDLNRNSFIENPLKQGEILYRTGDYGRWLPDGNIEFHGRADNQVKIRGFRVELGEIESIISGIEGIIGTVVKAFRLEGNDTRLMAFLDVKETFSMDIGEIARFLKSRMPGYMVPSQIKLMHGFPLTINGKIDRDALIYDASEIKDDHERVDIRLTSTEEKIYKIWWDVLKTEEILPTDNFFEIGGNSLLAISVTNRIEEKLNLRINFKDIRDYPTITGLSKLLENNTVQNELSVELIHLEDNSNLPLTKSQTRIWLLSLLNPMSPSNILPFTYKLVGPLDLSIFEKSIEILFNRHRILFSTIYEKDGKPLCNIEPQKPLIQFVEFNDDTSGDKESAILEFINKDSRQVMDLKIGPLYRLYLFPLSPEEHYFYFAIHHIVFDGWSWKVFIDDLNQIYNDLFSGKGISLKDLEYQQYDFADVEIRSGLVKDNTQFREFWEGQLEGCSTILNFPFDYPRLATSTGYGDREYVHFSPVLSSELRQISKEEGISLFSCVLTTFGILMHKYSGDHDLNIGTPVANRFHSSMEAIVGMFVNTVVIRLKFDKDISFKELLKTTNEIILEAIAHQDLSFEKIVEIVNPGRTANINPVFQVAFAWDENLNVPLKLDGVMSNKLYNYGGVAIFDLTCSMRDNGKEIEGEIEYNTDILKQDTIIGLRDNYIDLVKNLINGYDKPIASIPLITEEEKRRVLDFTDTAATYPSEKTIAQLFEEQVKLYPNKTAIVYGEDTLTYDQLNRKSNQLARMLIEEGIKKNKPVSILADKSIDLIVGILGILKAGGAYLPLDTEYPADRINFMIRDTGCRVILTQHKYVGLPIKSATKRYLDSPASYHHDDHNVVNEVTSSDLAYIMYTSGTTGKPKGSMIRQKSVVRLVRNTNYIDLTSEDRILLTGAIVFDATTFEIWGSLLNGGSLYILDKEDILDSKILGDALFKYEITTLWLTSSLFTQIAEYRTDIFSRLKYLIVGGDVLSPPHINKVRKDNPHLRVINGYGPTENTTFTTCYHLERDFEYNIPIGKPISNTTVYIFDKYLHLQPVGVNGELYIGGDGLSVGYLNREELNETSFIDNPYNPGERLYKTGDYGRWLPDGNIEFRGRVDNQVKIRGFRVEMGEIESIISGIEGIIGTVVKAIRLEGNDTRLVAFLDVKETFSMDTGEIAVLLRSKMPGYMVPAVIRIMHGFPLNINGKVDREALKYDVREIKEDQKRTDIKLTSTEEKIYKIWCDVLKTEEIMATDNFFEIGGNSLLAITIMSKIEAVFNIGLSLRVFFDSPRIEDIAESIDISLFKTTNGFDSQKDNRDSQLIIGEI